MEDNTHQIVLLARNWEKMPMTSKITLHSFVTNGQRTSFNSDEMLHSCVNELRTIQGKKFENVALILHELCQDKYTKTPVPVSVSPYNSRHNSHDMTNLDMSDFSSEID